MLQLGKRFWQTLTKPQRRHLLLLTGAVIVTAVLEVVNVSAIAPFLALASDPSIIERNAILSFLYNFFPFDDVSGFLIAVGIGVFILMLLSNAWSALTAWVQLRFVWSWHHQLSVHLLQRYLYRPYSYFLNRNTADLSKNLLSEVQHLTSSLIQPVVNAIGKSVVALGIVAVLMIMKPLLALIVTVVVGGSYGAIYVLVRKRLNAIGHDRVQANRERFTAAGEALGGIKDVKVLNVEQVFLDRFTGPSDRFSHHQATHQTISTLPRFAIETVAFGTIILIVVFLIATENSFGSIVPMLGLYAFAGYRLMPAVQQVFQGITAARFNVAALETVLADLESGSDTSGRLRQSVIEPMGLVRGLELKDVYFSYPNTKRPAVNNVSLTIPVNTTVGLVGATGSGKTTLADVILGLLRPQAGEILVDGTPLTEENLSSWQTSLGYVPQHIFLTDASVTENIAFGVPRGQINMEQVLAAAKIAQIDDFVQQELPRGYETIVGERGIRLSGGQRQRIGIARALYRDPDVIVFDEATSALDNTTEEHVLAAMKTLLGKKTIIMIAHRLTTLADCDVLCVVENGHLVKQGTYQELFGDGLVMAGAATDHG